MLAVALLKGQSAVQYLETIGNEFNEIQNRTWDYTSKVAHGKSARKVEKSRKEVIQASSAALRKVKAMRPFGGNTQLRDSAASFLQVNYAVLNHDYAKLMDMEEIAEQSYDAMEAYMTAREVANNKLKAAGEMIDAEYSRFAKDNNINLIENNSKLSKKMEIAGKVYDYYNKLYLVFFKSYKQEAYLMNAIEKNDVNGMEQNRNALAKTAAEGLEKLKTMEAYEGDKSVVKACQEMLEFYKDEAGNKFSGISQFYVAKDNFEKIKTGFDNIPANKRTQADVDKFNNAVADYNKASDAYNKTNNELNNNRNAFITNWNNASDKFTDKHVPKR